MSEEAHKSSVTVEIAGDSYTIRSDASPDHVRECAAYVDHVLAEVRRKVALVEGHKAFILAALALADELFRARGQLESLRTRFARLAESLAVEAESALGHETGKSVSADTLGASRQAVAPGDRS